jgi:outer membrane lipoprotein SlyB
MKSRMWYLFAVLALTALLAVSCSRGDVVIVGGGEGTTTATIKGRVLDSSKDPVAGAVVTSQTTSAQTQTDNEGKFTMRIDVGAHLLTVTKNGTLIVERCLAAAEQVIYDLGDIDPGTPTNCDVVCTNSYNSDDWKSAM